MPKAKRETPSKASVQFEVESIVGRRVNPKTRRVEYEVKWTGWDPEDNTWEPLKGLTNCADLVEAYNKASPPSSGALSEYNSDNDDDNDEEEEEEEEEEDGVDTADDEAYEGDSDGASARHRRQRPDDSDENELIDVEEIDDEPVRKTKRAKINGGPSGTEAASTRRSNADVPQPHQPTPRPGRPGPVKDHDLPKDYSPETLSGPMNEIPAILSNHWSKYIQSLKAVSIGKANEYSFRVYWKDGSKSTVHSSWIRAKACLVVLKYFESVIMFTTTDDKESKISAR